MSVVLRRVLLGFLLLLPLATQAAMEDGDPAEEYAAETGDAEAVVEEAVVTVPPTEVLPAGAALAREFAVRLDKLRIDATMMVYDESVTAYSEAARDGIAAMTSRAEKFQAELAERDAVAAQTFADNWKVAHDTLVGGGEFSEGILTLGYDAAQHAYFGDSTQQLAEQIAKAWPVDAAGPEEQASRLVARALANYILAAASPFGSYTASFNAGDADDPEVMVPRVTAALDALRVKYRGDAKKEALVSEAQVKWRFIRSALLVAGQKSMPTIVYRHGNDILRDLQTLQ